MTPKIRILERARFRIAALDEGDGSPYQASIIRNSLKDLDEIIAHEKTMAEGWRFCGLGEANE